MARVYDLEQLIEPTLLGCDKARISIEVNIFLKVGCVFTMVIWSEFRTEHFRDDDHREDTPPFTIWYAIGTQIMEFLRVFAFVMINLLLLQMNLLDILFN